MATAASRGRRGATRADEVERAKEWWVVSKSYAPAPRALGLDSMTAGGLSDDGHSSDESSDTNEDVCRLCSRGGNLICCDGCPGAFHLRCVKMKKGEVPEGEWFCMDCAAAKQTPSAPRDYEEERQQRIQANREKLQRLNLKQLDLKALMGAKTRKRRPMVTPTSKADALGVIQRAAAKRQQRRRRHQQRPVTRSRGKELRVSRRLRGEEAAHPEGLEESEYNGIVEREDGHGRLQLDSDVYSKNPSEGDKETMKRLMEQRCNNKARGSLYDSKAGICCHFCRQKKLCGEPGCPRCSTRSVTKECIGKSECSRCHGATGRFCRACLNIRYGWDLDEIKKDPNWICPHCYEEDHPEEGWICNSSFCMTRRGLQPTGIAIYEAQARGFVSVAHFVQAQLLKTRKTCPSV